jgi:hypothetical protein
MTGHRKVGSNHRMIAILIGSTEPLSKTAVAKQTCEASLMLQMQDEALQSVTGGRL